MSLINFGRNLKKLSQNGHIPIHSDSDETWCVRSGDHEYAVVRILNIPDFYLNRKQNATEFCCIL